VEVGCGNGHFLAAYCAGHPEVTYLGVELKAKRCLKAAQKVERRGLSRAYVVQAAAEQVLNALPDASVDRYHIYFPDPWPKARHRRRRFLRGENLAQLRRTLRPGGEVAFATDFLDYYLQAKLLCILEPELELLASPPAGDIFVSVYGDFLARKGRIVHAFVARRRLFRPAAGQEGAAPRTG
jgi:tRNA (guanine-N7-)-methyltransferase